MNAQARGFCWWGRGIVLVSGLACGLMCAWMEPASAARISDISRTDFGEQAARFFAFRDPAVRNAVVGSVLLGICCGVMGAFLVVRKLALMGDALSHAVLPGVALGFLWNMTKDPVAIFIGATAAGLLGAGTVQLLRTTTKHKEDAALGFVLASFYGLGICLFTMIQNLPGGAKSGLDNFMFGSAASLGEEDLALLGVVTAVTVLAVVALYKEYLVSSFDAAFARSVGLPVRLLQQSLMILLAFAIVSALQAVGVVLVSAMLIIPAAAGYLLSDRFGPMLLLSAGFGMLAGGVGTFFSFVGRNLPTGPFMVLASGAVFCAALFFGPRHGILPRWWHHRCRRGRVRRENALKAIYHALEAEEFRREVVGLTDLAQRRKKTIEESLRDIDELCRNGLVSKFGDSIAFTPAGWQRACEIVRNHRLWELYLTNAAHISPDHVHDDAELIEHMLGEEAVGRLEKRLDYARRDPHGRPIPGIEDMRRQHSREPNRATGYGPERGG